MISAMKNLQHIEIYIIDSNELQKKLITRRQSKHRAKYLSVILTAQYLYS